MARYRRREQNIAWAQRIVAWTNEHLQDADSLCFDSKKVATGKINKDKLTYNTALMLRANLGLHRLTGESQWTKQSAPRRRVTGSSARRPVRIEITFDSVTSWRKPAWNSIARRATRRRWR